MEMIQRFGNYQLHELLNHGGMTEIWSASDAEGQLVALRRLQDHVLSGSAAPKLFKQGLAVLEKLPRHPNIVGLRDHGAVKGVPYMALDLINGANLRELTLRADTVIQENVSDVIIGVADALNHLHDHGWMHLDLKPENIMVDMRGQSYLIDFDTAQKIPSKPKVFDKIPGTPAYMAPEQLLGRPVDHRADIYSFGATAYELLTRHKPFVGNHPDDTRKNQLDEYYPVPMASKFNPAVPARLNAILRQCLAYNPDRRYPNMTILNAQLHSALGVETVSEAVG